MADDMFDFEDLKMFDYDNKSFVRDVGTELKFSINYMIEQCHHLAKKNGFWDEEEDALIPESKAKALKVALMAEELFEAFKEIRNGNGNGPSDHIPEFNYEEEELADVIIRIFDYAGKYKLRLPEAIHAKYLYNCSRPYKHGKKF